MKKITTEIKKILQFNWDLRCKLWAEGKRLRDKSNEWKFQAFNVDNLLAKAKRLRDEGMSEKTQAEEADNVWIMGWKFRAESESLLAESNRLRAKANELQAERDKLRAEGNRFRAEADKLWAETIIEFCGNIKMEWRSRDLGKEDYECHLENGEIFSPLKVEQKTIKII